MAKVQPAIAKPVMRRTLAGVDALFVLAACMIVIGAIAAYGLR